MVNALESDTQFSSCNISDLFRGLFSIPERFDASVVKYLFRSLLFCRMQFFGGLIVRFTASQTSLGFLELSALRKNGPFVVLISFLYLTFEFRESEFVAVSFISLVQTS